MTTPAAPVAAPASPAPTSAPATTPSQSTAAPEQFFEVKVGGEMKKYTRAEAERLLSKNGYAEQAIQRERETAKQLAELREQAEREKKERAERIKADKAAFFKEHGLDWDAEVRSYVERRVAEKEMTPEQREAESAKAEAARLKKELEERTAKEKEAQQLETARAIQQRMETQLSEAAERAGLAKDADSFYAVYEAVKEWRRLKLPWDAERIIETAKENIDGGFKRLEQSVLKGLKGQALEDRLGKSVVDELIRHRIELRRTGGATGATRPPTPGTTSATKAPAQEILSPQEYMARARGGR